MGIAVNLNVPEPMASWSHVLMWYLPLKNLKDALNDISMVCLFLYPGVL